MARHLSPGLGAKAYQFLVNVSKDTTRTVTPAIRDAIALSQKIEFWRLNGLGVVMANPWFRFYAEFANDPKVQMLSEADQRRLTMLFCLRCNGYVTLQDSEVTFLLRVSADDWSVTKALFISKGFINDDNEILNWDKRQFTSDSSKNRVAAYRERKNIEKSISSKEVTNSNGDVTLQKRYCDAIDTDTDTDTDNKKYISKKSTELLLLEKFGIAGELADDFSKHRKAKEAPITKTALEGFQREAKKAGLSITEAVRVAIERNWQGFKADWFDDQSRGKNETSARTGGNGRVSHSQRIGAHLDKLTGNAWDGPEVDDSIVLTVPGNNEII